MRDWFIRHRAIEIILDHEGGYVNHPNDPGGETNFGISKRAHPELDIENLTRDEAIAIYRREYWDAIRGDDLLPPLALMVFDHAVNAGVTNASRMLQNLVGADQDGAIGRQTLSLANGFYQRNGGRKTLEWLNKARGKHYRRLPTYSTFGPGWEIRIDRTRMAADDWARAYALVAGRGL